MALARDFRELRVFQSAFQCANKIYHLSKAFPTEEKFSLTDQIRRSSRSVCSNIAEAWRKRRYPAAFVSKLSDADGEASETRVWLDFAKECGYISATVYEELYNQYDHINAQLCKMMDEPETWCSGSKTRNG
jgi:four helix bundle protein